MLEYTDKCLKVCISGTSKLKSDGTNRPDTSYFCFVPTANVPTTPVHIYTDNANGPQTFGLGWTLVFIRQCWSIKRRCTKKNIYTGTMCEYLVYVFRKRLPHCLAGGISYFSLREMNPLLRDIKRSNIGETLLRSGASIAMQYTDIQLPTDSQWKRIPVLPKEQALVNWKHHERA